MLKRKNKGGGVAGILFSHHFPTGAYNTMTYDIVTQKELQDITKEDVLKEANTECVLRNKVQAVAQGLVEGREGFGVEKVVELLERLSRDRRDGVEVEDGDNKLVRLKYGTEDYVYYTIFMGMLQNHPLISRRLEEFISVNNKGQGKEVRIRVQGKLGVVRLESGRIVVFNGNSVIGEVKEGGSNLVWKGGVSTKLVPKVARLIRALDSNEVEEGEESENKTEGVEDEYYY